MNNNYVVTSCEQCLYCDRCMKNPSEDCWLGSDEFYEESVEDEERDEFYD